MEMSFVHRVAWITLHERMMSSIIHVTLREGASQGGWDTLQTCHWKETLSQTQLKRLYLTTGWGAFGNHPKRFVAGNREETSGLTYYQEKQKENEWEIKWIKRSNKPNWWPFFSAWWTQLAQLQTRSTFLTKKSNFWSFKRFFGCPLGEPFRVRRNRKNPNSRGEVFYIRKLPQPRAFFRTYKKP